MEEKYYYLGFSYFPGIGPKRFNKLISAFGSAKNAWTSAKEKLLPIIGESFTNNFIQFRKTFSFEKIIEDIKIKNIKFITITEKEYPRLLKENKNAPYVLYVKGNTSILNDSKIIAVVGTRKITQYGIEITKMLTSGLCQNGFVIVSGLAFGVDATAHMTTLENKGKTIAVLGCGVDCCTPIGNQRIYNDILDSGGTIISSFRPSESASVGSFPARNAIIAGISLGVLVTEGARDSGSLITAKDANDLGRPIFAVPGPITSNLSRGTNSLLKSGASQVENVNDILENLKFKISNLKLNQSDKILNQKNQNINHDEQKVLKILSQEPQYFDEIVRKLGKESRKIGSLLSLMEIKGLINLSQDSKYRVIDPLE